MVDFRADIAPKWPFWIGTLTSAVFPVSRYELVQWHPSKNRCRSRIDTGVSIPQARQKPIPSRSPSQPFPLLTFTYSNFLFFLLYTNNLKKKRDCTGEGFDDQPEINLPGGELLVEEQDDVQLLESLRGRKRYASILSSFSLIFSKDLVNICQYTPSLHATEALWDHMYQNLSGKFGFGSVPVC